MNALLIVDLQAAFHPPARVVNGIRRRAAHSRHRIFTRFINPPGSVFRRKLKQSCCPPGSPDTQLLVEPQPRDLVFDKTRYGLTPGQIRRLKRRGITQVAVCGIDTDACVLGVLFSLFDAGVDCRAVPGLCWSSTGLHREALKIISRQFPEPKRLPRKS